MTESALLHENLKPVLSGKNVLLGVTGSIAAFKAVDLVRGLKASGANVKVVLSESAQHFVSPLTLETLSGQRVHTKMFGASENQGTHHIDLARWADVFLVAPATANTLAKLAYGLADDLLTTEALAFRGVFAVVPAMNPTMFDHPSVTQNLATLRSRGVRCFGPTVGQTACGEEGLGRMVEPEEILEELAQVLVLRSLGEPSERFKALVTLGPTQSAIDPVRFVSNHSSGKMGAALVWALWQEGFEIDVVKGPVDVRLPREVKVCTVQTADEMAEAVEKRWPEMDVYIGTAAVLDWKVKNSRTLKLKKTLELPVIEFENSPDILQRVSEKKRPDQFVLGFAAETDQFKRNALEKLEKKGCDAIFVNDVSPSPHGLGYQGFGSDFNGGWWLSALEEVPYFRMTKTALAREIVQKVINARDLKLRPSRPTPESSSSAGVEI